MDNGGYAVGEGDLLGDDELEQHLRLVFARVDLLGAQHGAQVGDPPGVDVKHGRHGHVYIPGIKACLGLVGAQAGHESVSMQHDLAVAEVDALGQARRTGGIKSGGHGIFVEIGEFVIGRCRGQQTFVFTFQVHRGVRIRLTVGEQNDLLDGFHLVFYRGQQGQEVGIDQDDVVFGVVDRIDELFRRQADVDGVQHRTHHGDRKKALQVAVAVPVHHCHGVPLFYAQRFQGIGQALYPLVQFDVGVGHLVPVDDLPVREIGQRGAQDVFDQQGKTIG